MKLRICEIMQETDRLSIDAIKLGLSKDCVQDYAYIVHDKDVSEDGKLIRPHWHIMLRFNDSYDTKYVSQWFGVKEEHISKIKGRFKDALAYLTHRNKPKKYQYDESEVVSNFEWKEERDKLSREEEIIQGIVSGTIREYNFHEYINPTEFVRYNKAIDLAYKYRASTIKGVERSMECVFITGEAGTGKTTYAKKIAEDKKYSVFVSSGSNDVLDGYQGQDCIILDDLRPSSLGLSDLLKMLDNNTASTVKSRYKNKVLECKLIVVTTVLDMDTFFNGVFKEEKEPIIQLKRRCKTKVVMNKEMMSMYVYDDKIRDYFYVGDVPNIISVMYQTEEMTQEKALDFLESLLGSSLNIVKNSREAGLFKKLDGQEDLPWK